jgi:hypothetical protein
MWRPSRRRREARMSAEVLALPAAGAFFFDSRGTDRALRVSRHDEAGVVVLSLWRGDHCVGTCRLAREEVGALIETLAESVPVSTGSGAYRAR